MAAGQGFIEFSTGDILTASAANGYLASQVVMVFASASARTSAIASPQEGMVSYLKDTNAIEYYSGSAWVAVGGGGGGGGKILQVVAGYTSTATTNSTTTLADTGLTATITPSSSSSKVLVFVSQNGINKSATNQYQGINLRLLANGTNISSFGNELLATYTNLLNVGSASAAYLDSPATTSAVTYKTQYACTQNETNVGVQWNSSNSSIILMEVGA